MWLLVTGTGRCGTGYIAHVLSSVGVKCTHEKVFGLRGLDYAKEQMALRATYPEWGWQADSSWLSMPWLGDDTLKDLTVVHLVRHPRNVIRSLARIENWTNKRYKRGQAFLYKHMPELLDWNDYNARSAAFWCGWNERIEPYAGITHRIEDDVDALLGKLDITYVKSDLFDNTHYNTRAFTYERPFELDDLPGELQDRVRVLMDRYGYEWNGHEPTRYELAGKVKNA